MAKKPVVDVLDHIVSEIEKTAKKDPKFEKKVTEITKNTNINPQEKILEIQDIVKLDDKFKKFSNLMETAYKATELSSGFKNDRENYNKKPKTRSMTNPKRLTHGATIEYHETKEGKAKLKALKASLNEMKKEQKKIPSRLMNAVGKAVKVGLEVGGKAAKVGLEVGGKAAKVGIEEVVNPAVRLGTQAIVEGTKIGIGMTKEVAGAVKKINNSQIVKDIENPKPEISRAVSNSEAGLITTEVKNQAQSIGQKLKSDLAARVEKLGKQVNKVVGKDKEKASGQSR